MITSNQINFAECQEQRSQDWHTFFETLSKLERATIGFNNHVNCIFDEFDLIFIEPNNAAAATAGYETTASTAGRFLEIFRMDT